MNTFKVQKIESMVVNNAIFISAHIDQTRMKSSCCPLPDKHYLAPSIKIKAGLVACNPGKMYKPIPMISLSANCHKQFGIY